MFLNFFERMRASKVKDSQMVDLSIAYVMKIDYLKIYIYYNIVHRYQAVLYHICFMYEACLCYIPRVFSKCIDRMLAASNTPPPPPHWSPYYAPMKSIKYSQEAYDKTGRNL